MTTWYVVPGVVNLWTNEQGVFKNKYDKVLKPFGKRYKDDRRTKLNVKTIDGRRRTIASARLVLSAKLGRCLEPWEDACHINGDPGNNTFENLKASCRINNMIDELELGRLKTSKEQILLAIERLKILAEMF